MSIAILRKARPDLDSANRYEEIRDILIRKVALRALYEESYIKFRDYLKTCPKEGAVLEIGTGGGFAKEIIPELITSDLIAYPHLDKIVDATQLPFPNESLRAVLMYNVLHHIPDAEKCFHELSRCLVPGGKIYIVDPYPGYFHGPILKYLHHEGFDPHAKDWKFTSQGPLSSANGALAWIIFERDLAKFSALYPNFKIEFYRKHSPLRYFLTGGNKKWNLTPTWMIPFTTALDKLLVRILPKSGSFLEIGIEKRA